MAIVLQALIQSVRAPRRPTAGSRRESVTLAVLAASLAALDISLGMHEQPTVGVFGPHAWLTMELVVDAALPVLPRFPRTVMLVTLAVSVAMFYSEVFAPGLLVPTTSVSPLSVPRAVPIVIIFGVLRVDRRFALVTIAGFVFIGGRLWNPSWDVTPFGLLSTAGPALGALYFDARKQLMQSLRDRADRAERERYLLAEQARSEERRRLAAEMHDVVTHQLSLIVLHAGALGLTSQDEAAKKAAEHIRESGTQALQELRDLVGVLRGQQNELPGTTKETAAMAPLPDLNTLIEESRSVGTAVELTTDGSPEQISPTVARTVHRIVQEALTNVRKHASGSKVRIELRYGSQGIDVTVTNTAPSSAPDPVLAGSGGGAGLAGLRQRVELVGGTLFSGPVDGGGYQLSAILPAYVPTTESQRHDQSRPRR